MPETEQSNINPAALPDFHTSSGDNVLFCPLSSVRVRSRGFLQMGGYYFLKHNGGDSVIKISVLCWRFSLIRVSVIRGSTDNFGHFCTAIYVYRINRFQLYVEATYDKKNFQFLCNKVIIRAR
jgi:hypothetical protein